MKLTLGTKIKYLRLQKGITQDTTLRELGIKDDLGLGRLFQL